MVTETETVQLQEVESISHTPPPHQLIDKWTTLWTVISFSSSETRPLKLTMEAASYDPYLRLLFGCDL